MIPHSKRRFVATESPSETTTATTSVAASQRPGWRTGTALISSGRAAAGSLISVPGEGQAARGLARGAVDSRSGDRARRDAPALQDREVLAVGYQQLECPQDRLRHPRSLRDRDAVGCGAVRFADELERALGLLDLVG